MIRRYKEIFFGLMLGLAMWIADAQMHTMMQEASQERQRALSEELLASDGAPLFIRLLYLGFALFAGLLLWRSNQHERMVRDLEGKVALFHERMVGATTGILGECNTLLRSRGLTGEALDVAKEIRSHARQIEEFAKDFPPLLVVPGLGSDTLPGCPRRLFSRVPGLVRASEYVDVALGIVYEGWGDRRRRFDRAHKRVWDYEMPVERTRYARILRAVSQQLRADGWGAVLEVGCAQGVFTAELVPHCQSLTACDISPLACERAAERCRSYAHVRVEQCDVTRQELPGQFDLVFALDLLEALHGRQRVVDVVDKLINAVRPGGLLILSSSRLPEQMRDSIWARKLIEGGDQQLACILARADVRLVDQELYPEAGRGIPGYPQHLIAVFQRTTEWRKPGRQVVRS